MSPGLAAVRHLVLGGVPVVVSAVLGPTRRPPSPGPQTNPWWSRNARTLGGLASDLYHSVFG